MMKSLFELSGLNCSTCDAGYIQEKLTTVRNGEMSAGAVRYKLFDLSRGLYEGENNYCQKW